MMHLDRFTITPKYAKAEETCKYYIVTLVTESRKLYIDLLYRSYNAKHTSNRMRLLVATNVNP